MKTEYEDFIKNKDTVAQLKQEIEAKEKERSIFQQQYNNLKIKLSNIGNINDIIVDIYKVYEKIDKGNDEKRKVKSRIDDIYRVYPVLRDYRAAHMENTDSKIIQEKMDIVKSEIDREKKRIVDTENQLQTLQNKKALIDQKKVSNQRESIEFENKSKELEDVKKKKVELEDSITKGKEEADILKNRIEGLEEKRVKFIYKK